MASARRLVLPLIKKNRMLSARLAWSRLAVHVVQLLNWAFQEVKPEVLPLYVSLAWDLTPLLSSSCSSHTLQGVTDCLAAFAAYGCSLHPFTLVHSATAVSVLYTIVCVWRSGILCLAY